MTVATAVAHHRQTTISLISPLTFSNFPDQCKIPDFSKFSWTVAALQSHKTHKAALTSIFVACLTSDIQ